MRGDGELNKTNSGANTNTTQILLDIFVLVCAFGITFLIRGQRLDDQTQLRLEVLTGVFLLLYLLSNKEGYLYNVTMFYYLDRVAPKDYEILRCCHAGDGDPAAVCRSGTGGKRILYYLSDHGLSVDQYKNDFWQTVDQNAGRRQGTQNGICGEKRRIQ